MDKPLKVVPSADNARQPAAGIRQRRIADKLEQTLRLHVGQGGRLDIPTMAEAAEMAPRAVRSAMEHGDYRREPRLGDGLVMAAILGDATINQLLAEVGYTGAHRMNEDGERACPHTATAEIAEGLSALTNALRTGSIQHNQRAEVARELREAAAEANRMAADLERESA